MNCKIYTFKHLIWLIILSKENIFELDISKTFYFILKFIFFKMFLVFSHNMHFS